jgi:hypothetical protein
VDGELILEDVDKRGLEGLALEAGENIDVLVQWDISGRVNRTLSNAVASPYRRSWMDVDAGANDLSERPGQWTLLPLVLPRHPVDFSNAGNHFRRTTASVRNLTACHGPKSLVTYRWAMVGSKFPRQFREIERLLIQTIQSL